MQDFDVDNTEGNRNKVKSELSKHISSNVCSYYTTHRKRLLNRLDENNMISHEKNYTFEGYETYLQLLCDVYDMLNSPLLGSLSDENRDMLFDKYERFMEYAFPPAARVLLNSFDLKELFAFTCGKIADLLKSMTLNNGCFNFDKITLNKTKSFIDYIYELQIRKIILERGYAITNNECDVDANFYEICLKDFATSYVGNVNKSEDEIRIETQNIVRNLINSINARQDTDGFAKITRKLQREHDIDANEKPYVKTTYRIKTFNPISPQANRNTNQLI